MIKEKEIQSDFQFIGNRVKKFSLETKMIANQDQKIALDYAYDFNVLECNDDGSDYFGVIEFVARITAKASKSFLFKIDLIMEGAFTGKKDVLQMEQFEDMLEINGVVTLSQISRSFLLSVTSQSGIKPPVRMPMINVVALRDKKIKQQTK